MDVIHHPSIILIVGRRRYGKSALGFYIMEKLHTEKQLPCYIIGFPKSKLHLLPTWVKPVDSIDVVPDNSISLIDEGSFKFHAHNWRGKETEFMDKVIAVSGQKKQTIIFITHTMRKFAVTLLLDVDMVLFKEPSLLHANMERGEVRKMMAEVKKEFEKLPRSDVKKSTYVISDGYRGFMMNPLPKHWSEELSEAWSGIDLKASESLSVEKQEEDEDYAELPIRIDDGLKLWFREENLEQFIDVMTKNSNLDGRLSDYGIQYSSGDLRFYAIGLKKGEDDTYYLMNDMFDIEKTLDDLKGIVHLDVESSFPLNRDMVRLQTYNKKRKEKTKDDFSEYADRLLKDRTLK